MPLYFSSFIINIIIITVIIIIIIIYNHNIKNLCHRQRIRITIVFFLVTRNCFLWYSMTCKRYTRGVSRISHWWIYTIDFPLHFIILYKLIKLLYFHSQLNFYHFLDIMQKASYFPLANFFQNAIYRFCYFYIRSSNFLTRRERAVGKRLWIRSKLHGRKNGKGFDSKRNGDSLLGLRNQPTVRITRTFPITFCYSSVERATEFLFSL